MMWFTDSVYEKMMIQKPNGRCENTLSVSHSPACESCPYQAQSPFVGYCIKILTNKQSK